MKQQSLVTSLASESIYCVILNNWKEMAWEFQSKADTFRRWLFFLYIRILTKHFFFFQLRKTQQQNFRRGKQLISYGNLPSMNNV